MKPKPKSTKKNWKNKKKNKQKMKGIKKTGGAHKKTV